MKKTRKPRKNSFVKFDFESMPKEYHTQYEIFRNNVLIYFGKIPNMPGHGIFMEMKTESKINRFHIGYHIENFVELSEDET